MSLRKNFITLASTLFAANVSIGDAFGADVPCGPSHKSISILDFSSRIEPRGNTGGGPVHDGTGGGPRRNSVSDIRYGCELKPLIK